MHLGNKMASRLSYRWIMVGVSFLILIIMWGIRFSFGVFFKSIESEFNLTRTATSGIFSTFMLLSGVFAIIGGWFLDKYGPRKVFIIMGLFCSISLVLTGMISDWWQILVTYSVLLSIGTGAGYTVIMITVSRWFERKRGLAMGITGSGAGLGTMVITPLAAFLISKYDWRTAYIVIGIFAGLVIICLSTLIKRHPNEVKLLPGSSALGYKSKAETPVSQIFKTTNFWYLWFALLLFSICLALILTHIVPHANDQNIPPTQAAMILSIIGGINLPGRIAFGWASDIFGRKKASVICAFLQVIAMLWLVKFVSFPSFILFALIYGIGYGGLGATTDVLIVDLFRQKNIGVIRGIFDGSWQIGAALGPLFGGIIFDTHQSYSIAFLIGALAMLVTAILILFLRKGQSPQPDTISNSG